MYMRAVLTNSVSLAWAKSMQHTWYILAHHWCLASQIALNRSHVETITLWSCLTRGLYTVVARTALVSLVTVLDLLHVNWRSSMKSHIFLCISWPQEVSVQLSVKTLKVCFSGDLEHLVNFWHRIGLRKSRAKLYRFQLATDSAWP